MWHENISFISGRFALKLCKATWFSRHIVEKVLKKKIQHENISLILMLNMICFKLKHIRIEIRITLMVLCKTMVSPVDEHWRYCSLVQSHQYGDQIAIYFSIDVVLTLSNRVIDHHYTELILGLCPANERRHHKVTPSLIGWAQT